MWKGKPSGFPPGPVKADLGIKERGEGKEEGERESLNSPFIPASQACA